jgi:hypothetical protein
MQQQESYLERNWKKVLVVGIVFLLLVNTRTIVLGHYSQVQLDAATGITGQVSQAFTSGGSTTLPVYNQDFTLSNTRYFENNAWVVTTIVPKKNDFNQSFLVMQKKNGVYVPILGPGTAFPRTVTENLPDKVGLYLYSLGAVYDPAE